MLGSSRASFEVMRTTDLNDKGARILLKYALRAASNTPPLCVVHPSAGTSLTLLFRYSSLDSCHINKKKNKGDISTRESPLKYFY